jgi:hypothetical protein
MHSFPNSRSIINTLNRTDKTLRRYNNPLYYQGDPDQDPHTPPTEGVRPSSVIQLKDGEPDYEAIPLSYKMSERRSLEISGYVPSHHEAKSDKHKQGND